ncbi:MAG: hypothetical protein ACOC5T_09660 [Elusimicrobiota bacterium]
MSKTEFEKELKKGCGDFIQVENIDDFPCYDKYLCDKCKEKLKIYDKGKQDERKRILRIIKPIVQKQCKGTPVNCYNLYQEIKKEIEGEKENE